MAQTPAAEAVAVAALESALAAAAALPLELLDSSGLCQLLRRLDGCASRLAAARLRVVREVDTREMARAQGAASTAAWLGSALRARPGVAAREVSLAEAIDTEFAGTGAALAAGEVSADAAAVVVAAVQALPAEVPAQARREAEAFLLARARVHHPGELVRIGRHLLHALDPVPGSRLAGAEEAAAAERELVVTVNTADGTGRMSGRFDAETCAALLTALEPLAAPRPARDGAADTRGHAQRLGDAFSELVHGVLDGRGLPTSGGERPHLTVTVPLETLECRPGALAAELDFAGPISAGAARRLACDAQIIPVVLGAASEPLDVGRSSYVVPQPLRRALVARDGGCAFPGCRRPAPWCHAHHIRHWADGGLTALCNLVLLCGHHHRLLHAHTGWSVRIGADGNPEFTSPPGRHPAPPPPPWRPQVRELAGRHHRRQARGHPPDHHPEVEPRPTVIGVA